MIVWLLIIVISVFVVLKVYTWIFNFRCTSKVCLQGKTAIVTGGCSGIGYQVVLALASRGCRIIIADKNNDNSIRDTAVKETHNPNIRLEYVDLASFNSVREFVERVKKTEDKLDILFNNAGIGGNGNKFSEDGVNIITQVNYYSAFLMTHLLVDLMKKSLSGRILFTSSLLCFFHGITSKNIEHYGSKMSVLHYPNSKYFQLLTSEMFAKKLKDYHITSNCWHPFMAKTPIFVRSVMSGITSKFCVNALLQLSVFGKIPEDAAHTGIHLACSDDVKDMTGKFFGEGSPTFIPYFSKELVSKLWKHSEEIVKLREEEKL